MILIKIKRLKLILTYIGFVEPVDGQAEMTIYALASRNGLKKVKFEVQSSYLHILEKQLHAKYLLDAKTFE